jgi:hypothetical protein
MRELLPHVCTLTTRTTSDAYGGNFLWHMPSPCRYLHGAWPLASGALCGVRTFLPSKRAMTCSAVQRYGVIGLVLIALATSWGCKQREDRIQQLSSPARDTSDIKLEFKYDLNGDGRMDRLVLSRFWPSNSITSANGAPDSTFESAVAFLTDSNRPRQLAIENQPYCLTSFFQYLSSQESHRPDFDLGSIRLYTGDFGRCLVMIPRPLGSGMPNKVVVYDADKNLRPLAPILTNLDSIFVEDGKLLLRGIELLRGLGSAEECAGEAIDYYPHIFYSYRHGHITIDTLKSARYNTEHFVWLGLDSAVISRSTVCIVGDFRRPRYRVVTKPSH